VLVDGVRVVASGRGLLGAFDRISGVPLWKVTFSGDRFTTQPVAVEGMVLVAEDRGKLLAFDVQTGEPRGALDPGSGFSQPVLARPGVAYVVSNGGSLFSLGLLP
jgi:outer membrane protein assembly factor BamB